MLVKGGSPGSEGKVDEIVGSKIRIQDDIQNAALIALIDHRNALGRRRHCSIGRDDADRRPFRHEQATIGQEGHAPGLVEPFDYDIGTEDDARLLLRRAGLSGEGGVKGRRVARKRFNRIADLGDRL